MSNSTQTGGTSVAALLGVAFIVLKLTHVIDWSWWWVLALVVIGGIVVVAGFKGWK